MLAPDVSDAFWLIWSRPIGESASTAVTSFSSTSQLELVANSDELFETLERGQGVYIIVYKDDQPEEIFFAGYSFD
jgi:hypothetical protein